MRCSGCGLGVTTPLPGADAIGALYPPSHYGSGGPRYHPAVERIAVWFRRSRAAWISRLHRPGAVLEVGCGHGYLLAGLRDRGWRVQGVELHDDSAAYGRKALALPIAVGELAALRFPAAAFDVVVFWHSFEHLPDPRAALSEAVRLLAPGGLVIVAVPNMASWQARWAGPHWFHWEIPRHLFHFDPAALGALFRRAGLEVLLVSHANWEQNPFGWIQSAFNMLGFPTNEFFAGLWAVPGGRGYVLPFSAGSPASPDRPVSARPPGGQSRSVARRVLAPRPIVQRLLAPPLLLGAFLLAALETACRRGATMTVVGRPAAAAKVG
jgi:SAM-dependent methyltransferase